MEAHNLVLGELEGLELALQTLGPRERLEGREDGGVVGAASLVQEDDGVGVVAALRYEVPRQDAVDACGESGDGAGLTVNIFGTLIIITVITESLLLLPPCT